jgi:hypothetical protein
MQVPAHGVAEEPAAEAVAGEEGEADLAEVVGDLEEAGEDNLSVEYLTVNWSFSIPSGQICAKRL